MILANHCHQHLKNKSGGVSQPCRFFLSKVSINNGKEIVLLQFDAVKIQLFSEMTMAFAGKMCFLG